MAGGAGGDQEDDLRRGGGNHLLRLPGGGVHHGGLDGLCGESQLLLQDDDGPGSSTDEEPSPQVYSGPLSQTSRLYRYRYIAIISHFLTCTYLELIKTNNIKPFFDLT